MPASKIPSDVLLHVFLNIRDKSTDCEYRNGSRALIPVCRVCRHWRNTALECPTLWTRICASDILAITQRDIKICLKRSKKAELDINMRTELSGYQDELIIHALLSGQMHRVRSFKLEARSKILDGMLPRLVELTQRAKTLELSDVPGFGSFEMDYVLGELPDVIPNVQLEKLSLHSLTLPWTSRLYHGLSELIIKSGNKEMRECYRPTVWQFIDALAHCPNLQNLKLDGFYPFFDGAGVHEIEERRLCFTQLKNFEASRVPDVLCAEFFAMFAISANANLNVSVAVTARVDSDNRHQPMKPLSLSMLVGRKPCTSIDIVIRARYSTVRSNHELIPDTTIPTVTADTIITAIKPGTHVFPAIHAILKNSYWQDAHSVTITLDNSNSIPFIYNTACMNRWLWILLLDGLPKFIKKLIINFSYTDFDQDDVGFDDALLSFGASGPTRLRELEQLTVYYAGLPEGAILKRREELSECIVRHNKYAKGNCKVSVLEQ